MNEAKLDQVFNLNSSDEVFSFMKDYAHKNQDLSAALIRHFFPDDIDLDALRDEVRISSFSLMRENTDGAGVRLVSNRCAIRSDDGEGQVL